LEVVRFGSFFFAVMATAWMQSKLLPVNATPDKLLI